MSIADQGIPAASLSQIFIDFDGTITRRDVLDDLILRYARDESWKTVEAQWQSGQIGSRECLAREFALLNISREDLLQFLDTVEVDPGLDQLLQVCHKHHVPLTILSDGIDFFIRHILQRDGHGRLPVRANTLKHLGGQWILDCPWSNPVCPTAAAHCKCASMELLNSPGRQSIYIGDGRSDLCPARKAPTVFAKNALARCLDAEEITYLPYATLRDVAHVLAGIWQGGLGQSSLQKQKAGSR